MGDKILKIVEAVLGGVVTFMVLYLGVYVYIFGADTGGLVGSILYIMVIIPFSFFMIFVYYYLLTKNKNLTASADSTKKQYPPIPEDKKMMFLIGLVATIAYYYVLASFSDKFTALIYSSGLFFLLPFITTRRWSFIKKAVWVAFLFAGGFLFEYILTL